MPRGIPNKPPELKAEDALETKSDDQAEYIAELEAKLAEKAADSAPEAPSKRLGEALNDDFWNPKNRKTLQELADKYDITTEEAIQVLYEEGNKFVSGSIVLDKNGHYPDKGHILDESDD